jgi:hypothetical protein
MACGLEPRTAQRYKQFVRLLPEIKGKTVPGDANAPLQNYKALIALVAEPDDQEEIDSPGNERQPADGDAETEPAQPHSGRNRKARRPATSDKHEEPEQKGERQEERDGYALYMTDEEMPQDSPLNNWPVPGGAYPMNRTWAGQFEIRSQYRNLETRHMTSDQALSIIETMKWTPLSRPKKCLP